MTEKMKSKSKSFVRKETVGILGCGEIGSVIARICREAGYKVLVRELKYDEIKNNRIDYLHVNIPESDNKKYVEIVSKAILEIKPRLTIINSSVIPGTTKKIFEITKLPIVHSPVIGLHPHLYDSVKNRFPKIIGPVNRQSLRRAMEHWKRLGLKMEVYKSSNESEATKLLDLVYYAWNIIFCKWVKRTADRLNFDFDDIYIKHNKIYNQGYGTIFPNVVRPIMIPHPGPIGGHCTIPDTILFHKYYKSNLTSFILEENEGYKKETKDLRKERQNFLRIRSRLIRK